MGDNLTIFKKGLVLIAIPLFFQLVFIGLLLRSQQGEIDAHRLATHTKDVIAYAEGTSRSLMEAHAEVRSLVITAELAFARTYRDAIDRVQGRFDKLRELVSDNPAQKAKVDGIAEEVKTFRDWLDETVRLIQAGSGEAAWARIKNLSGKQILDSIRAHFDEFLAEEERLDSQRMAAQEENWARQSRLLAGSLAASLGLALGMTYLFSRGISGRLAVLTGNVKNLATGHDLAEPLSGRDEIGQLDRAFHDMARSLAERDRENEMFIYSVSHDLRSPLVNLQGFGKELAMACKDVREILEGELTAKSRARAAELLDRDVHESIHFIQSAVSRLAAIIDALLRLSRAGRVEYRSQSVDVGALVARVVEAIGGTLAEKGVRISAAELPPAWGDPTAIEQIFANLIGNAVNYLDPKRPGRIEVGAGDRDELAAPGFHTYYVRDNGQGIPDAYQPKLFLAFQRFHKDSAPGEGIGLTLIRRAVERHGGTIRLESTVGEGSTFYVTLPSRAPEGEGISKQRSGQGTS